MYYLFENLVKVWFMCNHRSPLCEDGWFNVYRLLPSVSVIHTGFYKLALMQHLFVVLIMDSHLITNSLSHTPFLE